MIDTTKPVWELTANWKHAWLGCQCPYDAFTLWERNFWNELSIQERKELALDVCPDEIEEYTDDYFEHDGLLPVMVYGQGPGLPRDTRVPYVRIEYPKTKSPW